MKETGTEGVREERRRKEKVGLRVRTWPKGVPSLIHRFNPAVCLERPVPGAVRLPRWWSCGWSEAQRSSSPSCASCPAASHPQCHHHLPKPQQSQALLRGLPALRDSSILFAVPARGGRPREGPGILGAASCHCFRGLMAEGLRKMEQEEVPIHGRSYTATCQVLRSIHTSERSSA